MSFRLARAALDDLESVDDYTVKKWGVEQPDTYLAMLWATFERIAQTPSRWRLRPELHPECRVCFAGSHAIFYCIRGDSIEVARVLHGTMDFSRHTDALFDDS